MNPHFRFEQSFTVRRPSPLLRGRLGVDGGVQVMATPLSYLNSGTPWKSASFSAGKSLRTSSAHLIWGLHP